MSKVVMLWHDLEPYLSESNDADLFLMVEQVQGYMGRLATITNPIAASGGLYKAFVVLEDMQRILLGGE